MSCTGVNFSEEELKRISAQTLGMDVFDGAEFEKAVRGITVMESGDLEFHLTGGERKYWKNLHLGRQAHRNGHGLLPGEDTVRCLREYIPPGERRGEVGVLVLHRQEKEECGVP